MNIENEKLLRKYGFHCADNWLHFDIRCGLSSIYMTEDDLLFFADFLESTANANMATSSSFQDLDFQSSDLDEDGCIEVAIGQGRFYSVLQFSKEDFQDIIDYLRANAKEIPS